MSTAILSIRIKSDLERKMEELRMVIETIEKILNGVVPSSESAWKSIREFREKE